MIVWVCLKIGYPQLRRHFRLVSIRTKFIPSGILGHPPFPDPLYMGMGQTYFAVHQGTRLRSIAAVAIFSRCSWYWDVTLQETVDSQILYSYGEKIPQARTASKDYLLFPFQVSENFQHEMAKWCEMWFGGAKPLLILKRAWDSCLSLQPASLPPKNQSSNKNPSRDLPYEIDNGQYSWIGLRLNFKRKRPYTFHGNNMSISPGTGNASGDHSRVPGDHSAACGVQVEAPMFFVAGMSPQKTWKIWS